jgi:hypothetical protein
MPRNTVVLLIACAHAAALAGCAERAGVEWLGYAETVPQPALRPPGPERLEAFAPATRPAQGGPTVNIEARFITAPHDLVARLFSLKADERLRITSSAQVADAIAALQSSPHARMLVAPRLMLFSGQKAFVMVETQSAFVSDLRARRGDSGPSFEPVIDAVPEGTRLTVSAQVEGDVPVLTHIEAVTTRVMSLRSCTGRCPPTGKGAELNWQEAILAEAVTPVMEPCSIRLQADQRLLLRMPQRARQTVGNARLYARGPVVERTLPRVSSMAVRPHLRAGWGELAPAELETVLVIGATAVGK